MPKTFKVKMEIRVPLDVLPRHFRAFLARALEGIGLQLDPDETILYRKFFGSEILLDACWRVTVCAHMATTSIPLPPPVFTCTRWQEDPSDQPKPALRCLEEYLDPSSPKRWHLALQEEKILLLKVPWLIFLIFSLVWMCWTYPLDYLWSRLRIRFDAHDYLKHPR